MRLGVALDAAKIKLIGVRRCATAYPAYKNHHPGHILGAQELADALVKHPAYFGSKVKTRKMPGSMLANMAFLENKKGVLFILNGWGTTDHIDLWNGQELKGGMRTYFNVGEQIWFWHIA
jgi:hypothetical protein